MSARYVFHVRFRLTPRRDVTLDPQSFETTMYRPVLRTATRRRSDGLHKTLTRLVNADNPDDGDGWLFFHDHLWRGELADTDHFTRMTADALDVQVEDVEYRRLEIDEDDYDALKEAIASNLDRFKADSVTEALNKYLGSSVEVEPVE